MNFTQRTFRFTIQDIKRFEAVKRKRGCMNYIDTLRYMIELAIITNKIQFDEDGDVISN